MSAASVRISSPGERARRGNEGPRARLRALETPSTIASAARHAWAPAAIGIATILVYGRGFVGYDAGWALLWGKQIAAGQLPAFEAPGAPTPHPLANVVAAVLSPLGDAAGSAFMVVSALCFGLLAWAAYLLGSRLFGRLAGALFAGVVFTRPELIGLQGQAPIDVPFLAFVLLAAALEVQRPRRAGAVLVLLTLAGLLRPEGWLFCAAYVLYLLMGRGDQRSRLRVLALGAIAPCAWVAFDLAATGDPVHSLHGTQQLAAELQRPRGLAAAIGTMPAGLSELLGTPLALTGLAGCLAAMLMLYERALLPAALGGVGLCTFVAFGLAGLPILSRYLIVPVVVLGLFAAVALVGWRRLDRDDRRRTPWMACSMAIAGLLALGFPAGAQHDRLVVAMLHQQGAVQHDLHELTAAAALRHPGDRTVHVATRRAVPLLAAWLDLPVERVSADEPRPGARALVIRPASPLVASSFASMTTPNWSTAADPTVAWHELLRNASWVLYETEPRRAAGS